MRHPLYSARFVTLAAICLASLSFTLAAPANTPAAPPAPAVVAPQNSTPAPATPPTPTEPLAPAPAARREEEEPATSATAAPGARLTVFQKAASYLHGREAQAAEIVSRDNTITDLRAQLASATAGISARDAELIELRQGRDQLQTAVAQLEGDRRTVTQTVASLGFEQSNLPAAAQLDHVAENSVEGLALKLKSETDDVKRSEIRAQMIALRDAKK